MPSPFAIVRVGEGENRLVGDGFDQSRAEQRNRDAPRDDHRLRRQLHLAAVEWGGEELK